MIYYIVTVGQGTSSNSNILLAVARCILCLNICLQINTFSEIIYQHGN